MEQFPGNSRNRAGQPPATPGSQIPAEEPKLEKVVTGTVVRRKKPLGRRILDNLFRGDGGVISYLAKDVLVPAFQVLITDMVTQGIERAVYGEVRTPPRSVRGVNGANRPHISYDRPNTIVRSPLGSGGPARRPMTQPSSMVLEEVILSTDFDAQIVMEALYEALRDFGAVTVANLKEALGESPTYVDYKWGWRDLEAMHKKRIGEGFLVYLPNPENLR